MPRKIKVDEASVAKMYLSGKTFGEVADYFGFSNQTATRILIRQGYRPRTITEACSFPVDEHAFDEINEQTAYWVGFIMADGYVRDDKFRLGLSQVDIGHLEKLRSLIKSKHKITYDPRTNTSVYGFTSARILSRLAELGITYGKLKRVPRLDLVDNRDFWRGVVDGDGYLGIGDGKRLKMELAGSKATINMFIQYVKSIYPDTNVSARRIKGAWRVGFGRYATASIVTALYKDSTVYLDRKKEVADKIMSIKLPRESGAYPSPSRLHNHGKKCK